MVRLCPYAVLLSFAHRGAFGVLMNRDEYYHIEPLDHYDSMVRLVTENKKFVLWCDFFICLFIHFQINISNNRHN